MPATAAQGYRDQDREAQKRYLVVNGPGINRDREAKGPERTAAEGPVVFFVKLREKITKSMNLTRLSQKQLDHGYFVQ